MYLDGYLLIIADRCHICFACHFQTVHPIPVIFISISTEINSSFQWNYWFYKLGPVSVIPFQIMHMHRKPHPAYHTMFMCWLFYYVVCFFPVLLLRVGSDNVAFMRIHATTSVCLLHGLVLLPCGISRKMTIPSKSLLSLLASFSLYRYVTLPTTSYIMSPMFPCQASNPPSSAPLIALLVAGEVEICSMLEHGYVGISQYLLF